MVRKGLLILVLGLAVGVGCRRGHETTAIPIAGGPPAQASSNRFQGTPEARWPDEAVARAVRDALIDELGLTAAARISVDVHHGVAMLSGDVDTPLVGEAALSAADSIRGVRSVVDQISVDAPRRPAAEIARDVHGLLEGRGPPALRGIDVSVQGDGLVTLKGTVDSGQLKQVASRVAVSVQGATAVRNEIMVVPVRPRPDAEIVADVKSRLRWSLPIDARLVTVTSAGGTVTLTGEVARPADRDQAARLAWVTGVNHVNDGTLQVDPDVFPDQPHPPTLPGADDASIATAVRDALFYDPRVTPSDVSVDVKHAVVALRGTPSTVMEKRAAEEDARATVGAQGIDDLMRVVPATSMSDHEIALMVRRAFARDPVVDLGSLDVRVIGGEVLVRGRVVGELAHARALEIASAIPGVRSVGDGIIVVRTRGSAKGQG